MPAVSFQQLHMPLQGVDGRRFSTVESKSGGKPKRLPFSGVGGVEVLLLHECQRSGQQGELVSLLLVLNCRRAAVEGVEILLGELFDLKPVPGQGPLSCWEQVTLQMLAVLANVRLPHGVLHVREVAS